MTWRHDDRADEAEGVAGDEAEIGPGEEARVVLEADELRADVAQIEVGQADVDAVERREQGKRQHDCNAGNDEEEVAIDAKAPLRAWPRGDAGSTAELDRLAWRRLRQGGEPRLPALLEDRLSESPAARTPASQVTRSAPLLVGGDMAGDDTRQSWEEIADEMSV